MRRILVAGCIIAMLVASGCGGDPDSEPLGPTRDSGPEADVTAVRAVVDEALRAAVSHDWGQVCAQFTAEFAAQQAMGLTSCADGLAYQSLEFVEPGTNGLHPERAGEELLRRSVRAVVVTGDFARVALELEGYRDPGLLSAIREDGAWKLDDFPGVAVPFDLPQTSGNP